MRVQITKLAAKSPTNEIHTAKIIQKQTKNISHNAHVVTKILYTPRGENVHIERQFNNQIHTENRAIRN